VTEPDTAESTERAQKLRSRRMGWGFSSQLCTWAIIAGLYALGMLPGAPLIAYFFTVLLINLSFVALIKNNINLRFRDPSMTAAQIIAPLWPAIFIMFFISDPQARTAFLLMATGGLLFGMFALSRRDMILVSATILTSYLILLLALHLQAPQRINWAAEIIIVFAYASVLMMVSYLGSIIADMRFKLKAQNKQLFELASRDPLTQLPNRRSLMTHLSQEVARTERRTPEQNHLCISMLDVDHFKRINDTWGHDVGDNVLCRISEALRQCMRQGDFIGRFGGEEFILILPESTKEAAVQAAERIKQRIADLQFPELPAGERITISQGLTMYRAEERIAETLKRADDALYKAKGSGRNQVVVI
jgi:diguanylate cyclase